MQTVTVETKKTVVSFFEKLTKIIIGFPEVTGTVMTNTETEQELPFLRIGYNKNSAVGTIDEYVYKTLKGCVIIDKTQMGEKFLLIKIDPLCKEEDVKKISEELQKEKTAGKNEQEKKLADLRKNFLKLLKKCGTTRVSTLNLLRSSEKSEYPIFGAYHRKKDEAERTQKAMSLLGIKSQISESGSSVHITLDYSVDYSKITPSTEVKNIFLNNQAASKPSPDSGKSGDIPSDEKTPIKKKGKIAMLDSTKAIATLFMALPTEQQEAFLRHYFPNHIRKESVPKEEAEKNRLDDLRKALKAILSSKKYSIVANADPYSTANQDGTLSITLKTIKLDELLK